MMNLAAHTYPNLPSLPLPPVPTLIHAASCRNQRGGLPSAIPIRHRQVGGQQTEGKRVPFTGRLAMHFGPWLGCAFQCHVWTCVKTYGLHPILYTVYRFATHVARRLLCVAAGRNVMPPTNKQREGQSAAAAVRGQEGKGEGVYGAPWPGASM